MRDIRSIILSLANRTNSPTQLPTRWRKLRARFTTHFLSTAIQALERHISCKQLGMRSPDVFRLLGSSTLARNSLQTSTSEPFKAERLRISVDAFARLTFCL